MRNKSKLMIETQIKNTKINRITFLVAGIISALMGIAAIPFLIFGIILIVLSFLTNKKYKELLKEYDSKVKSLELTHDRVNDPVADSPYIFLKFKVAGVTYKNGRKTRQAILRAIKFGDEDIESLELEQYEYEGRPAVYVKINDQIIGNIPADTTDTFLEYEQKYKRDNTHCEVYGGSRLDDGTRTNYGCEVFIRYLR